MSTSNDHSPHKEVKADKNNKYDYLKKLDTSKLQALLQQESFLSDDENFDAAFIRQIMEVLDEREPVVEEIDVNASLKAFRQEIIPELERERGTVTPFSVLPIQMTNKKRSLRSRFTTVLIAAIVTVLLGSTIAASAMGYKLWEYVINWGKGTFQIGSGAEVTGAKETINFDQKEYQILNEAIDAFKTPVETPKWLPDGFKFNKAYINVIDQQKILTAAYQLNDKTIMFAAAVYSSEEAAYAFEINEASGESIQIEGNKCYTMSNVDKSRIVWVKGNIVYSIKGNASSADLINMVKSIYKGDH